MHQLNGTVTTLRGTPYVVREAFYVVFRQSGPRYVLPDSIAGDGVTIFPILIDIAPSALSGSRERYAPRVISAEELGAARTGVGVDEGDPDEPKEIAT
jgi:hypothetical protein